MANHCSDSGCGGELESAEATWNESMKKAHLKHMAHASHTAHNLIPVLALPIFAATTANILYQKLIARHLRCKRCGKLQGTH